MDDPASRHNFIRFWGRSGKTYNSMVVRKFVESDLPALISLWQECDLLRPWNDPESDISRAMAGPSSTILVGTNASELVASVMVGHDGHRGWMYYVAVSPALRKHGLGREMVNAAEKWLSDQGAIKSMLMVRRTNSAALVFYESLGYSESEVTCQEKWLTPDGKRPGLSLEGNL